MGSSFGSRVIRVRASCYGNIANGTLSVNVTDCSGHPPKSTEENIEIENTNKEVILTQESQIILFPNPVNDILNIQIPDFQDYALIQLFDLQGKLILSLNSFSPTSTIELKNMSNGMYVLNIISNNINYIQKIFVNR
jgi:hypothetical protein